MQLFKLYMKEHTAKVLIVFLPKSFPFAVELIKPGETPGSGLENKLIISNEREVSSTSSTSSNTANTAGSTSNITANTAGTADTASSINNLIISDATAESL